LVNKKRKSIIISVVALIVILAGIFVLVMINSGSRPSKKVVKSSSIKILSKSSSSSISSSSSSERPIDSADYTLSMGERLASQPLEVIGQISIPDLKINLPIFRDAGDTQILYGAGTVGDNSTIGVGNISLASHHVFYIAGAESYLFSPLTAARTGMLIFLTDKTYVYEYKIDNLFVVPDTDLSVLDPVGDNSVVTLIYCVNFTGPDRAIVRGTLVSKKAFVESDKTVQDYFTGPFNQIPANQVGGLG
jgi:sortase A